MMDNQGKSKRIIRNTSFLYVRMGLVLIVSLFTTRIVLNALGVVDYGIYNVVAGFVSMFSFLNTSMSNGIQRFYNYTLGAKGEQDITKVYNTAIQLQIILAIVLLLLLETIGLWYINKQMVIPPERMTAALIIFQCSIVSLMIIVLQIPFSAAIMAYERMDYFAYVSIFDVFAKLGIAYILLSYSKDKLILYGILHLIVTLIGFLLYFFYCKYHFKKLVLKFSFDRVLFRKMLSFSGWNVFGTFANLMKSQGLNLLLNAFFGPIVNAARGVSYMVMNAIHGFSSNIVVSFRPQLVQSYASGDTNRVNRLFFTLSKVSYILLFSISLPIVVEISYILHLWLGKDVPDYTISFTVLVLVNLIINSLHTPLTQIVHAVGKMKTFQLVVSIVICSILPVSWVFLKMGADPTIVYWVSLAFAVINLVVSLFIVKSLFPLSITKYLKKVILPCACYTLICPIAPIIPRLLMGESIGRLIIVLAVSIISSGFITYWGVLDNEERKLIMRFILKK